MLPTPTAANPSSRPKTENRQTLAQKVTMLAAPQARDWRSPRRVNSTASYKMLNDEIASTPLAGTSPGLKLQPAFVEWMMGFPDGWTELPGSELSAMRSSRRSRSK
jgi:hypothetical protein